MCAFKIVADDYGISSDVNKAISDLVSKRIVTKVSVMANESIQYSRTDMGEDVETGFHINLTATTGLFGAGQNEKISPPRLVYLIFSGKLKVEQIINTIKDQHEILKIKEFNFTYLDTHHHIHIIPKVLQALVSYANERGIKSIRCISMENRYLLFYFSSLVRYGFIAQIPKMIVLYLMGSYMKRTLNKARIRYRRNLVLMPLATKGDYAGLLRRLIAKFKDTDAELVVHPGMGSGTSQADDYSAGRYIEYCSMVNRI
ncbi:MAG: ChbG/HpnK family deacetylase [Nitrospiraceae bacterium]|nr:MAG: ChbG/HpnK family deacetylase [Nitrospiraceae bacterium]